MALQAQNIDIVFGEGVDTKTNAKLASKPKALENAVLGELRAINKRRGYTALGTSILGGGTLTASASEQILASATELLQVNARTLFGYSSTLSAWVQRSNTNAIPSVNVARTPVVESGSSPITCDACSVGNITMVAWEYGGPLVHVLVYDNVTGTILLQDTAVSGSARTRPRCLALGTTLYVLYNSNGANLIERHVTTAAPQTLTAETTLATDMATAGPLDAAPYTASKGVIAYNTSTANQSKIAIFDSASSTITSSATFAKSSNSAISVLYHSSLDHFFVAYQNSGVPEIGIIEYTSALAVSTGATQLATTNLPSPARVTLAQGVGATSGKVVVFYTNSSTAAWAGVVSRSGVAGTYAAEAKLKPNCAIAAKPFIQNSERLIVPLIVSSQLSDTAVQLVDYERGDMVATCLRERAANDGEQVSGAAPSTVGLSATQFFLPVMEIYTVSAASGALRGTVGISALTLTFSATRTRAKLGNNVFMACGRLLEFDGLSAFENGFQAAPYIGAATASGAGGSMATGSYQFCAIYTWLDASGQRHRSAPSNVFTVAVTGPTGKVDVQVNLMQFTEKRSGAYGGRSNMWVEVYSTLANGAIFYRYTSISSPTTADQTVPNITVTRTAADASILGNDPIYTTGGTLENDPAPATNIVVSHRNRLFCVSSEFPRQVWYSKEYSPGEGVAFSGLQTIEVGDAGDVTALASLDDKLVIFKRNQLHVVAGDGPDDTGSNNTFALPALVSSDVGCTNPLSVVTCPAGVLFQSAKGIYLLSRSLAVQYIGAAVETYNAQTITAALLVDDLNQVRFFTAGGTCLVWDYAVDQWGTFTNIAAVDAVIFGNVVNFLRSSGEVRQEAAGVWQDAGTDFNMRVRTPWIKTGPQGWMRVRRVAVLGDYKSAHTLQLKVYRDYDDNLVTTFSQPTSAFVVAPGNVYQIEFDLPVQKCEALSFELQDTGANPGQALSLSALSLTVGLKPGLVRVPSNKSY